LKLCWGRYIWIRGYKPCDELSKKYLLQLSEIIKRRLEKIQNQNSGRSAGKSVYYANYKVMKEAGPDPTKKSVVGISGDRAGGEAPKARQSRSRGRRRSRAGKLDRKKVELKNKR